MGLWVRLSHLRPSVTCICLLSWGFCTAFLEESAGLKKVGLENHLSSVMAEVQILGTAEKWLLSEL